MESVRGLVRCKRGVTIVEYAILLGMIALLCILIVGKLGTSVKSALASVACNALHGDAARDCTGTSPGNSGGAPGQGKP
jgi:Flp pilus assembly pilin Flp